jgi:hypothetical protein
MSMNIKGWGLRRLLNLLERVRCRMYWLEVCRREGRAHESEVVVCDVVIQHDTCES